MISSTVCDSRLQKSVQSADVVIADGQVEMIDSSVVKNLAHFGLSILRAFRKRVSNPRAAGVDRDDLARLRIAQASQANGG